MGNDLEYRIKTIADVEPLQQAERALKAQIKATKELGKESTELERHLKKVDDALNSQAGRAATLAKNYNTAIAAVTKAGGDARGLIGVRNEALASGGLRAPGAFGTAVSAFTDAGGGFGGLRAAAGAFGGAGTMAVGGVVAAIGAGTKAIHEYADAEQKLFARNAALKQRGRDTEQVKQALDGLADSMQDISAIDNDRWTAAFTTAIQAGADPANMARTAEMIKNAAGLPQMFGNIEAAAESVGKAINGNFEQFTRLGFVFSEDGTRAQKLDELMRQLATRGGGQLEERAKTLHGQFDKLKNASGDFFKSLGKDITDSGALQPMVSSMTTALEFWAKKLRGAPTDVKGAKDAVRELGQEIETAEQHADNLAKRLGEIRKGPENAAKQREKYAADLDEQDKKRIEDATDKNAGDVAKINALEQMGAITPQEAERKRRGLANGLEDFKTRVAGESLKKQIDQRKIQQSEAHAQTRMAADKAIEEESKLSDFQKLKAEEEKIARHFDNQIEPKVAEAQKRYAEQVGKAGGLMPGAGGVGGSLGKAAETDAEVARLKRAKEEALKKFRAEHGEYDVTKQTQAATEARQRANAIGDASLTTAEENASEIALLEERRRRLGSRAAIQQRTRGVGDFTAEVHDYRAQNPNASGDQLREFVGYAARSTGTTDTVLNFMRESVQHMQSMTRRTLDQQRESEDLRRQIQILQSQIRNSPGRG